MKKNYEPFLATSRNYDYTIKIWNLYNNTLKATLIGYKDVVSTVEFFSINNVMYLSSASKDDNIKLWDLNSFTIKNSFEVQSNVYELISIKVNNIIYLYSIHKNGDIIIWSDNVVCELLNLEKRDMVLLQNQYDTLSIKVESTNLILKRIFLDFQVMFISIL